MLKFYFFSDSVCDQTLDYKRNPFPIVEVIVRNEVVSICPGAGQIPVSFTIEPNCEVCIS